MFPSLKYREMTIAADELPSYFRPSETNCTHLTTNSFMKRSITLDRETNDHRLERLSQLIGILVILGLILFVMLAL